MSVLWQFRTKNFTVRYEDTEEHHFDLSWDDTGECRKKLDSGEWQMFTAKVSVLYRDAEVASSYLGGCVYADPKDFRDHVGGKGEYGSYFRDMVGEVIDDTRRIFTNMPILREVTPAAVDNANRDIDLRINAMLANDRRAELYQHPGTVAPKGWDSVEGGAYASDRARRESLEP